MDIIDEAQQLEADRLADALAARRAIPQLRVLAGFCCACGDLIEPERNAALPSATRCYHCQVLTERTVR
jgi:phage/conjugal plasmid C-4 type zinc finger TraR family protein